LQPASKLYLIKSSISSRNLRLCNQLNSHFS